MRFKKKMSFSDAKDIAQADDLLRGAIARVRVAAKEKLGLGKDDMLFNPVTFKLSDDGSAFKMKVQIGKDEYAHISATQQQGDTPSELTDASRGHDKDGDY